VLHGDDASLVYIADKNNSLDWLFQVDREAGESSRYDRFVAGVGGEPNIHPLMAGHPP
jgi:hypothetical protein